MFDRFFKSQEEQVEPQKQTGNSSTSGTDDMDELKSPKLEYQEYLLTSKKLQEELTFKLSNRTEDYRNYVAYSDGGMTCDDPKQVDKLRSVGKEMIKIIGRKILSGEFNITKISFPIRACYPKTALYNSIAGCNTFPYFMTAAAKNKDPIQRFKLVMTCFMATPYYLNMFLKPLNPILGETLQGTMVDGTLIYAQQISHHPPVTAFLVIGPDDLYRFSGIYDFDIKPGLNSLTLKNKGTRRIQFHDGGVIEGSYPVNEFSATFLGTSRIQQIGECHFTDSQNGLTCRIEFDKVKKRPSDYFSTVIRRYEKQVSKMFGTYCGYIQFDGVRYWDGRDVHALHIELKKKIHLLPSDWSYREDIIELLGGEENVDVAQKTKEHLEEVQRHDAKLRKMYQEQVEKGEEERKKEEKRLEKQREEEEEERKKEEKKMEKDRKKEHKKQKEQKEKSQKQAKKEKKKKKHKSDHEEEKKEAKEQPSHAKGEHKHIKQESSH